jgi:hypothetical protein
MLDAFEHMFHAQTSFKHVTKPKRERKYEEDEGYYIIMRDLYFVPNMINMTTLRIGWEGHVARMGEIINTRKYAAKKRRGEITFETQMYMKGWY